MTQHYHHRFKNESQDARRHDEEEAVHPFEKGNKKKARSTVEKAQKGKKG